MSSGPSCEQANCGPPAIAGLVLPGWPGPDLAAGMLPGLQPVAEVLSHGLLEQADVVCQARKHGLPFVPGERLARTGVTLQEPLEPGGDGRPGGARQVPPCLLDTAQRAR
jgi:hypothetical protein